MYDIFLISYLIHETEKGLRREQTYKGENVRLFITKGGGQRMKQLKII